MVPFFADRALSESPSSAALPARAGDDGRSPVPSTRAAQPVGNSTETAVWGAVGIFYSRFARMEPPTDAGKRQP